jgi:hypothetical protein
VLVALEARVHRDDAPHVQGRTAGGLGRLELRMNHLPPVGRGAQLARDDEPLAHRHPPLHPWAGLEPGEGDAPGLVGQHRLEAALPGADHQIPRHAHGPDRHPALAGPELPERAQAAAILVDPGQEEEQVAHPVEALPLEHLHQPRGDADARGGEELCQRARAG